MDTNSRGNKDFQGIEVSDVSCAGYKNYMIKLIGKVETSNRIVSMEIGKRERRIDRYWSLKHII